MPWEQGMVEDVKDEQLEDWQSGTYLFACNSQLTFDDDDDDDYDGADDDDYDGADDYDDDDDDDDV